MTKLAYLEAKRRDAFRLGAQHRETLVSNYMTRHGMCERPFLKEIVDDLLIEVQGVRLREEVLPLDTFAQTEVVDGRVEVSINSRIKDMPGVKDPDGVANVAKWHESFHVDRDLFGNCQSETGKQLSLPELAMAVPQLIVCRRRGTGCRDVAGLEFVAENAALAAAIAPTDLARSSAFKQFRAIALQGGDITSPGWTLLYDVAGFVGVNITALTKYLCYQGVIQMQRNDGKSRLLGTASLWTQNDGQDSEF